MKKTLLIISILFLSNLVYSQSDVQIEFVDETTVLLNKIKIDKQTHFDKIKEILGKPVIYKKYLTGKTNYHYKDLGISIHTFDNKLIFIGVNYNWDGDKTFPETTYTGNLKIDGIEFEKNSNDKITAELKNLEFLTVMPGFLISKPKTDKKNIFAILGFKDSLVTQVGFEFH